ncbi:MAG: FAD-binding protein [Acidobacteria bacterium]|nr:FAD-binding protein [Acidobacteriota bacterium]
MRTLDTPDAALEAFAREIGPRDPVTPRGGRTQWDVGGAPDPRAREVSAPSGIVSYEPADMTVRVRAGTTVAELDAVLAEQRQMVPFDAFEPARATVGGVLAVGRSGVRRLRYGPIRDSVLELRFVSADGLTVKAGGPTVKNVSGFDLCKLLVGSLGTLGIIAQTVLRVQPRPPAGKWLVGEADPFETRRRLLRPSSILWDGTTVWVLLEGHPADVQAEAASLGPEFRDGEGPPALPTAGRRSIRPSQLRDLTGSFVAEIGVGVVHTTDLVPPRGIDSVTMALQRGIKTRFDPTGRLNPGRSPEGLS